MISLPLRLLADFLACLRFYSRLPVPVLSFEAEPYAMLDFATSVRVLPFAGFFIGGLGGLVLWGVSLLGLPPLIAAAFALSFLLLATGAFHEDGLADTADGLGGGMTVERKLEIMKDSRIGTFGGAALIMSLLLRTLLIAEITQRFGAPAAALVMAASGGASRVAALMLHALLPSARNDGAAWAAAKPLPSTLILSTVLAIAVGLAPMALGLAPERLALGLALMALSGFAMAGIAQRQIKGMTGDIAGATQQVAEILFFAVLASRFASI
jgi:adenosylcobinamide-GDP ribazoletransferase